MRLGDVYTDSLWTRGSALELMPPLELATQTCMQFAYGTQFL